MLMIVLQLVLVFNSGILFDAPNLSRNVEGRTGLFWRPEWHWWLMLPTCPWHEPSCISHCFISEKSVLLIHVVLIFASTLSVFAQEFMTTSTLLRSRWWRDVEFLYLRTDHYITRNPYLKSKPNAAFILHITPLLYISFLSASISQIFDLPATQPQYWLQEVM